MAEALSFKTRIDNMVDENVEKKFIAALDIGTTTVRCHIVDRHGDIIGSSSKKVHFKTFN